MNKNETVEKAQRKIFDAFQLKTNLVKRSTFNDRRMGRGAMTL